ncbi:hypothetical protein Tco_0645949 [Tanacetum coccineum]|uniref:Uncharacterized protein n=1 Tax=Tanacetum coccineum TaxID=301880 RepID=A0ABQ5A3X4_9ASTR
MAESSSHNLSSPEITPKEERVTLDKPESPNPFLPASQVEFSFDEISFTTNNETLDDSKIWVSIPTSRIRRDIGYSGEIKIKGTLKNSFLPPRVKVDYAKLIWDDIIQKMNKKTREKVVPYPSVHNWALKPNQTEGPPSTDHMKSICNLDMHVDSKAPKPSLQIEEVPQGKKPGAKSGLKRKQSSKHASESKIEASKSKTGQS